MIGGPTSGAGTLPGPGHRGDDGGNMVGAARDEAGGAGGRKARGAVLGAATAVAALALALTTGGLQAQGFSINEHGACQMARGGTGTATPCDDGSAVFWNPAAVVRGDGVTLSAGGLLLATYGEFTRDFTGEETDLDNDPIPVPHLFATWRATDRLGLGLGVYAPYGLETNWPTQGFEGRFSGYENSLQSIYVQPTVAYRLSDAVSIGGGPTIVIGSVELNQRLDLSRQPVPQQFGLPPGSTFGQLGVPFHTGFADAGLEADGATGIGGNFGIRIDASDRVDLGARYTTSVELEYEGDASFEQVATGLAIPPGTPPLNPSDQPVPLDPLLAAQFQSGGALVDQAVTTTITMPDQAMAGVALDVTDRLTLLADWHWQDWSDFDVIPLNFEVAPDEERIERFEDTHAIRLGMEVDASRSLALRGGYVYHDAAAPDETVTPLLPEAKRNEVTAGLGWTPSPGFELNLAYQFIAQSDRRGRVVEPPAGEPPTTALNGGLYSFGAHLFSSTLTFHF